jgi:hypothetical protein
LNLSQKDLEQFHFRDQKLARKSVNFEQSTESRGDGHRSLNFNLKLNNAFSNGEHINHDLMPEYLNQLS